MHISIERLHAIFTPSKGVNTDTRSIKSGELFFALTGPHFNGNKFAKQALQAGATHVVVDDATVAENDRFIVVDNVLKTLQDLATFHRRQLKIPVVAIAGSNGKTTTKEITARVLQKKFTSFFTPGNLNNHIGVPLSLLQLTEKHQIAVIELGANHLEEHRQLCEIAQPDYGILTNVGKDHLEGFGGFEGVKKANKEVYNYLRATGGKAFLNADDELLMEMAQGLQHIKYGSKSCRDAVVCGKVLQSFPLVKAALKFADAQTEVQSKLFGSFQLYNILAAACIGKHFGVPAKAIKAAVEEYTPQNNRSQIIPWGSNTIILDAYNANPSSMELSLRDFAQYPAEKKFAILGDMFELGNETEQEHLALLQLLQQLKMEAVLVGEEFYKFKNQFSFTFFPTRNKAEDWLRHKKFTNTTFFVKGSRGIALENAITNLVNS